MTAEMSRINHSIESVTPTQVGDVSGRSREIPHAPIPKLMTIATANENRRIVEI
jgi:hypothetical protein